MGIWFYWRAFGIGRDNVDLRCVWSNMNKDAKITGVWGGRGSGKSTRIKEIIATHPRVITADPLGEYQNRYLTHKGLYTAMKNAWSGTFKLSLDVSHHPDPAQSLLKLSRDLLLIQRPYFEGKDKRKLTLVIDEMSIMVPNKTMKSEERDFLRLCNLGRHYGIEIIGASQRLAQVHPDFRGNCAENYFFRMASHIDIQAAKQVIGPSHENALRELQTHHYLHYANGSVTKGKNNFLSRSKPA